MRAERLHICLALSRPGVNGVLGTPDVIEDLLLDALDDKVVIGSMNRGGLAGTAFEVDDRFTAYDAEALEAMGYEGGKMLLRIDPDAAFAGWSKALALPSVFGLVAGRALLFPPDGDVAAAVDTAVGLLERRR